MVTLTGTFTRLDGTPATGTVRVMTSRSPIMDPDGKIVISGPQVFPLDGDGKLSVQVPASNDPDLGPPFTYWIDVNLTHASWKINKVWIPHGSTTVDLSEIADYTPTPGVATRTVTIPADGEDGQVLVWDGAGFSWDFPPEGPQGPPGEVTTAALTTALAGKVSGAGMSVRVDTTVGTRVLLDHPGGTTMLMGETPAINAIPYIISGWKQWGTFPLTLRRVGNRVYLTGMIDGTEKTAGAFLQPPIGYRPASARTYPGIGINWNTGAIQKTTAHTTQISADGAPSGQYNFTISWDTADPWPTI